MPRTGHCAALPNLVFKKIRVMVAEAGVAKATAEFCYFTSVQNSLDQF